MNQEIGMKENFNHEDKKTVLVVEPMKAAYVKEISLELESLQMEVGGDIESIAPFNDSVELVMNAEGKYKGLPLNRGVYDGKGRLCDVIAGTFLVVGVTEDDFGALTQEQVSKYMEKYKMPEVFAHLNGKLVAVPAGKPPEKENGKKQRGKIKKSKNGRVDHER